ncbi:MAG: trypsin-like peptidase domain-containing protein, partial [Oscillospiraceae bacterium]|nr:trypsin-like peptidase domain-containing protein [Oscillospiraceae bacterium]
MRKNWLGYMAVGAVCAMLGAAIAQGAGGAPQAGQGLVGAASAEGSFVPVLPGAESPIAQVVDTVLPCVVGVSNRGTRYRLINGRSETVEQASGSGVVISEQGHIVTNHHVVENASAITVIAHGQQYEAELVGVDPLTDLAVLQVKDAALPAVTMGDSDAERVGNWAIVIGNPLGQQFADTVTVGIISGVNREIEDSVVKMIQTDAAINQGNSGGGLFNTKGELIGIPSMKFYSAIGQASIEGIGMAIPINVAKPIVQSIIAKGYMVRPRIGVGIATIEGADEGGPGVLPAGVFVNTVERGGPAD